MSGGRDLRLSAAWAEESRDILPWIPQDEAGLEYRQECIAEGLAAAYRQGMDDAQRTGRPR